MHPESVICKQFVILHYYIYMQASGDGIVEESLDIAFAGVGKFHVHAKFSLDTGDKIFEIHPPQVKGVKMVHDEPQIAANTMTCTFEAKSA